MITDIIVIAFILIMAFIGWKRGFLLTLISLATTLISLAVAWFLMGPMTRVLEKAPFLQPLAERIEAKTIEPLQASGETVAEAIAGFGLPSAVEQLLIGSFADSSGGQTAWQDLSSMMFRFALSAGLFLIITSVIIILIVMIGRKLTDFMDKLPLLGFANRFTGLLINLIFALVIVHVILFIAALLAPLSENISSWLESSAVLSWFYQAEIWHGLLDTNFS